MVLGGRTFRKEIFLAQMQLLLGYHMVIIYFGFAKQHIKKLRIAVLLDRPDISA